jgi:hypothetical protein
MSKEKLNIRIAKHGDAYYPGWGGHYKESDGTVYFLTNARATTFRTMEKLKSHKEQFEFFCLAYLREMTYRELAIGGESVIEIKQQLATKYGMPWSGNTKNTLPAIGEYTADRAIITPNDGLNLGLLRQKFNEYKKCEFVIYTGEVGKPPIDSNGKLVITGDPLWDLEVGNYTYYQVGPYKRAFAIPNSVDFPELRKRLAAAALSINLGIDSIDYTLKHYSYHVPDLGMVEEPAASLLDIEGKLRGYLKEFEKKHSHQHNDHEVLGIVAASYALARCQSTIEACLVLSGRGFFVDACILGRHVIEQVAWALAISDLNSMDLIRKTEPQKCISHLSFHPYGRWLYGTLSEFTHLSTKRVSEYLRIINDKPTTVYRSTEDALRLAPLLILVLDIYLSGSELFYMKECSDTKWGSWKPSTGKPILKKNRPLWRLFKKHRDKYKPPIQS